MRQIEGVLEKGGVTAPEIAQPEHRLEAHPTCLQTRSLRVEKVYQLRMPTDRVARYFQSPDDRSVQPADPGHCTERWFLRIYPEDRERVVDFFVRLSEREEVGIVEHRIVCYSGEVRWVAHSCVARREEDGQVRIDGFLVDINDRKVWEERIVAGKEEAEAATRQKDHFVSLVAHDLRSPFSSIIGLLKMVVDDKEKPLNPRHATLVNRVLTTCQQQLAMINELLNLSRIQAGALKPERRFAPVAAIVENVAQGQIASAELKKVDLITDIRTSGSVYVDRALITEALNNLVSNAIKFSVVGGKVRIVVTRGATVTIAVVDSGYGVPPEFVDDLFRYEVKTTCRGTNGEEGTGLGLPFCADIMRAHGGSIDYTPDPGGGSIFILTIPVVTPEVMVVDDDELVRESLDRLLVSEGYRVEVACDGEEALARIEERPPHLLITDLSMKGKDGYWLISRLKRKSRLESIPVIILTGRRTQDPELFKLGVDDYLVKPTDPDEIVHRVRRFLGEGESDA